MKAKTAKSHEEYQQAQKAFLLSNNLVYLAPVRRFLTPSLSHIMADISEKNGRSFATLSK